MADLIILVEAVLPSISGINTDRAVNTFTFLLPDGGGNPFERVETFYNTVSVPGDLPVCSWLATSRDRSADACEFRAYDITAHLNGSDHGPPTATANWTLAAGGAGTPDLPAEVAVCCSFGADMTGIPEFSGGARPRARHRGRVYIGPLRGPAADESVSGSVRPHPDLLVDIAGSAHDMAATDVANDAQWVVWSRTNAAVYPVTHGWVDDAFDTVRGRGIAPSMKESWVLP